MKLTELKSIGTYVSLRVLEDSANNIIEFCKQHNIPCKDPHKLHVTVLYSKKPHAIVSDPDLMHSASFIGYDLFDLRAGDPTSPKVLVAKLNAPSIVARHLQLMAEHGATYDFPQFIPHISLSYNYTGDTLELPPMNVDIILGKESSEQLDLTA